MMTVHSRLRIAFGWAAKLAWMVLLTVVREAENRRPAASPAPLALPPPSVPAYSQQALDELHAIRRDIARLQRSLTLIEVRLTNLGRADDAVAADDPRDAGFAADGLNEAQLAARLGVTARTLQSWRKSGTGPPHQRLGRRVLYRRRAVDEWLARRLADDGEPPAPGAAP